MGPGASEKAPACDELALYIFTKKLVEKSAFELGHSVAGNERNETGSDGAGCSHDEILISHPPGHLPNMTVNVNDTLLHKLRWS